MVESLEWDDLPIVRKSLIPGRGFFQESDEEPTVTDEDLAEATVVALADGDADGLTAAALVRAVHGEVTLVPTEPRTFGSALSFVAETIGEPEAVYILDLSIEAMEPVDAALTSIVSDSAQVVWHDHHEWDEEVFEAVSSAGIDLVVGESDEVATADVTLEELDIEDAHWHELVEVVRDHDLWLREDPRSDDLADYSHWSDPEEFIETVSDHGADLPESVMEDLTRRREEKQALIDTAISRAEYRSIGEVTVGITYGRCSQNEVAEGMRSAGSDVAVVIKPSGGISFRGTESFQRCHEVAAELGGGGHPKAAGCKPDIFTDMLDYAYHWVTCGATARQAVLDAFDDVLATD